VFPMRSGGQHRFSGRRRIQPRAKQTREWDALGSIHCLRFRKLPLPVEHLGPRPVESDRVIPALRRGQAVRDLAVAARRLAARLVRSALASAAAADRPELPFVAQNGIRNLTTGDRGQLHRRLFLAELPHCAVSLRPRETSANERAAGTCASAFEPKWTFPTCPVLGPKSNSPAPPTRASSVRTS